MSGQKAQILAILLGLQGISRQVSLASVALQTPVCDE
jgi:hypothetical protein